PPAAVAHRLPAQAVSAAQLRSGGVGEAPARDTILDPGGCIIALSKSAAAAIGLLAGGLLVGGFDAVHAQQTAAQTNRYPQFENDDVKVWKSVITPNGPLTPHRHEHPRVLVALSGGTMKLVEQGGKTETGVWETGKAYWLP